MKNFSIDQKRLRKLVTAANDAQKVVRERQDDVNAARDEYERQESNIRRLRNEPSAAYFSPDEIPNPPKEVHLPSLALKRDLKIAADELDRVRQDYDKAQEIFRKAAQIGFRARDYAAKAGECPADLMSVR
jgi:hypothetical protein